MKMRLPYLKLPTSSYIGSEFFKKCLMALLVASLLIILYVALRFRKIGGFSGRCNRSDYAVP